MSKYNDLKNKVVVISGAAGSIAEEITIEFIKNHAIIFGLDKDIIALKKKFISIKKNIPMLKYTP